MSIYLYGGYGNFKLLKVEFRSRKGGHEYVHTITLDNNELISEDNVEVWSRYLEGKIASLVTPEAMQSDEYQQIAERFRIEEEAERNSLIPVNKSLEKALFIDRSLDWECSLIGYGIDEQGKQVDALLGAGMTHDAIVLFLQIVKYMCKHFISEEHWCMFDDVYDPDYSCELILGSLNKAAHAGNLSVSDKEYFHKAWEEIQAMEACQQYGIANYKIEF